MNKIITVTTFFNKFKDRMPYSLSTLRKLLVKNEDKLKGVVLIIKNEKRLTYKVLKPDVLLDLILSGEIK